MKQYIGMIEVLGEGGELQPLHWNPKHLVDGRAILVVDEIEGIIWVWLGNGTTMIQRTTALRQARFIMRNGFRVEKVNIGTKCTNFIEISGNLKESKAATLQNLLKEYPKTSEFLIAIKDENQISTFDEVFQDKVETIEQTIMPEPIRRATPIKRRMLSYEEQLATKVLFAVADCYGQATMIPIGPNEFQVTVLRLQLRFTCQADAILFTEIRAVSQEDIDAFSRCFGQQPQLSEEGQQIITAPISETESVSEDPTKKDASVVDTMRVQLSQLTVPNKAGEHEDEEEEPSEDDKKEE